MVRRIVFLALVAVLSASRACAARPLRDSACDASWSTVRTLYGAGFRYPSGPGDALMCRMVRLDHIDIVAGRFGFIPRNRENATTINARTILPSRAYPWTEVKVCCTHSSTRECVVWSSSRQAPPIASGALVGVREDRATGSVRITVGFDQTAMYRLFCPAGRQ